MSGRLTRANGTEQYGQLEGFPRAARSSGRVLRGGWRGSEEREGVDGEEEEGCEGEGREVWRGGMAWRRRERTVEGSIGGGGGEEKETEVVILVFGEGKVLAGNVGGNEGGERGRMITGEGRG